MAHRGPIVATGSAWATLDPLAEFLLEDVLPVMRAPAHRIKLIPDVLKNGFFVAQIFASLAIELPQDAVFANREEQALAALVHEHTLKNDIEIEGFGGSVLVVPCHLSRIYIDGQSRTAE